MDDPSAVCYDSKIQEHCYWKWCSGTLLKKRIQQQLRPYCFNCKHLSKLMAMQIPQFKNQDKLNLWFDKWILQFTLNLPSSKFFLDLPFLLMCQYGQNFIFGNIIMYAFTKFIKESKKFDRNLIDSHCIALDRPRTFRVS